MIRKIKVKFLWGLGFEGRQIPWVDWHKVCSPTKVGGLRIREIGRFIGGLLAKWKWKTEVEEEGLWKEILELRYRFMEGYEGGHG